MPLKATARISGCDVEQPVDRVRTFPADRRIGARVALTGLAHVPQRDPVRCDKGQSFSVARRGNSVEQRENDRPEEVARMGIVLAAAQRLFAGQGPEYQNARLLIGDSVGKLRLITRRSGRGERPSVL